MNILVAAATTEEILPLLQWLETSPLEKIKVKTLVHGVGAVPTTYHLTTHLLAEKYDLCIQAGIAGAYNRELKIGDAVVVESQAFANLGSEDADCGFQDVFDLGLIKPDSFPFQGRRLQNPDIARAGFLRKVNAISSDKAHGCQSSIDKIVRLFRPDIESMEGAAFFYVCLQQGVPFLELRTISNYVEPRDKRNWDIPLAIDNLNKVLTGILMALDSDWSGA